MAREQQGAKQLRDYFMHPTKQAAIAYARLAGFQVTEANETVAHRADMPDRPFYLTSTPDRVKLAGSGSGHAHYWKEG